MSSPTRQHPSAERRLAAIMFTDIVGYTKLTGKDAKKALDLVRQSRDIQKPLVEKHHGQWLKEMGDGAMAQFNTALDAVNCALEIQRTSRADFEGDLRIGIHLGDLTIENGDVFGDGVNIASRLESIADPGGVYISDAIEKAIRGQSDVQAQYLGEIELKNVDYGVRTYALQGTGLPIPQFDNKKNISGHFWAEVQRRGLWHAGRTYILFALLIFLLVREFGSVLPVLENLKGVLIILLILGLPAALFMAWRFERSPEGFVSTSSEASWRNPYGTSKRKPLTGNLVSGLLFAGIMVLLLLPREGSGIEASESSVGVIPFRNYTGSDDLDHYGMGLASEVRTQLAISKSFDFISSMQATNKYQKSDDDPQAIGQSLGVTHIVSGMYQGNEDNLQVIVELVEANSGRIIWSIPYQSQYENIFDLQAEIAKQVLGKFNARRPETDIRSYNIEAYSLYHRGFELSSNTNKAAEKITYNHYYEKAIALDSTLLEAWVELLQNLSYYYWMRSSSGDSTVTMKDIRPIIDYVNTHFPDSWQKNEALGTYSYWVELDYGRALEYFNEAIEENPESFNAISLSGAIYRRKMEYEKALALRQKELKINSTAQGWSELGTILRDMGKVEDWKKASRNAYDLNPDMRDIVYFSEFCCGDPANLDEKIKNHYGGTYYADLLMNRREWAGLLTYTDTATQGNTWNEKSVNYFKSYAHHQLGNESESMKFASAYFDNENKGIEMPFEGELHDVFMASFINDSSVVQEVIDTIFPRERFDEDLSIEAFAQVWNLFYFSLSGRYEQATQSLINFNDNYPNYGWYNWLDSPHFDRIKKEHPPFNDAIRSLKIPQPREEVNPLKM